MSHFTVMVVTDSFDNEDEHYAAVEEALQPFHEYECTGVNDQHVIWVDETKEKVKEYHDPENTNEMIFKGDKMLFSKYSDQAKMFYKTKSNKKNGMFAEKEFVLPEGYELRSVPVKEVYSTIKEYLREWEGYDDENFMGNEYGRWTNPNAKWDWWQIGGRWKDDLLLKDGTLCDYARKGDIDFDTTMKNAAETAATRYDEVQKIINGRPFLTMDEVRTKFGEDNWEEIREFYWDQDVVKDLRAYDTWISLNDYIVSREEYITRCANSAIGTFAVLKDGVWSEKGDMGWWACVSNENENWSMDFLDMLKEIPDDKVLTVVDCHI